MARIVGIELSPKKKIIVGLTSIYGIGNSRAKRILAQTKTNPNTWIKKSYRRTGKSTSLYN